MSAGSSTARPCRSPEPAREGLLRARRLRASGTLGGSKLGGLLPRLLLTLLAAFAWTLAGAALAGERIVVVGDVHGAYGSLREVLAAAEVIDAGGHWSGGRTRLVQLGDVLDRGSEEKRALDLLMKLEGEARTAGGEVIVLLGNHEVMNLIGDWRYVSEGGLQEFGGAAPRRAAFARKGIYGRWLRGRPAIAMVDGNVFVHGGVSAEVARLGLRRIRRRVHEEIMRMDAAWDRSIRSGALLPGASVDELLALRLPDLENYAGWLISHPDGPLWFRGFAEWDDAELASALPGLLAGVGAKRFVVGHSVQLPAAIRARADGRVLLVDTGMLAGEFYPGGAALALEIRGDELTAIDAKGGRTPLARGAPPDAP